MTLRDIEIDHIMDQIEAQRAMNNRWFCDWMRETLKCPRCSPFAKRMIGKVVVGDEKITELDKVLCA